MITIDYLEGLQDRIREEIEMPQAFVEAFHPIISVDSTR